MKPATVFSVHVWLLMLGIASGRPAISEAGSDSYLDVTNDYTEILSMRENLRLALNGLDEDSAMRTAEQFVFPAFEIRSIASKSDDTSSTVEIDEQTTTVKVDDGGQVTPGFSEVVSKTVNSIAGKISGDPWVAYGLIGLGIVVAVLIVSLILCCCFKR